MPFVKQFKSVGLPVGNFQRATCHKPVTFPPTGQRATSRRQAKALNEGQRAF
jgi:hypothetical protein